MCTAHSFCWDCYRLLSLAHICSLQPTTSFKNYLQGGFGPCVLETLNVHFEKLLLISLLFLGQYPHFFLGKTPFFHPSS